MEPDTTLIGPGLDRQIGGMQPSPADLREQSIGRLAHARQLRFEAEQARDRSIERRLEAEHAEAMAVMHKSQTETILANIRGVGSDRGLKAHQMVGHGLANFRSVKHCILERPCSRGIGAITKALEPPP